MESRSSVFTDACVALLRSLRVRLLLFGGAARVPSRLLDACAAAGIAVLSIPRSSVAAAAQLARAVPVEGVLDLRCCDVGRTSITLTRRSSLVFPRTGSAVGAGTWGGSASVLQHVDGASAPSAGGAEIIDMSSDVRGDYHLMELALDFSQSSHLPPRDRVTSGNAALFCRWCGHEAVAVPSGAASSSSQGTGFKSSLLQRRTDMNRFKTMTRRDASPTPPSMARATNPSPVSVVLTAPSVMQAHALEDRLQRCLHRLRAVAAGGGVIPGAGLPELICCLEIDHAIASITEAKSMTSSHGGHGGHGGREGAEVAAVLRCCRRALVKYVQIVATNSGAMSVAEAETEVHEATRSLKRALTSTVKRAGERLDGKSDEQHQSPLDIVSRMGQQGILSLPTPLARINGLCSSLGRGSIDVPVLDVKSIKKKSLSAAVTAVKLHLCSCLND